MPDISSDASPESDNATAEIGFRSFPINNTNFMCPPELQMELINAPTIYPIPNSTTYCVGLINVRGSLVPVFNIHALLDSTEFNYKWILILGELSQGAAIVIDNLPNQHFSEDELELTNPSNPPKNLTEHIQGSYNFNGIECHLLNYESLFEFLSINK